MKQNWEKELKNKLAKFWWTECSVEGKGIDFSKIDGSNDFSIIPQNSKGIIQMQVGEFLSIIDEVFLQAKQEERERILKELPKEKSNYLANNEIKRLRLKSKEQQWAIRAKFKGFNDCLKQIKDIIRDQN